MKICGKCGTHILETAEICWNCKSKVDELPELQPESQPEQPCETQAEAQVESSNMKRCDQCGACIPKTAEMCWSCKSKIEKQPEPPRMKFCEKCGAQMAEEAQVCMSCGCAVKVTQVSMQRTKPAFSKKKIVWITATLGVLIAVVVAGLFIWNHIRTKEIVDDLSGKTFRFYEHLDYSWNENYYILEEKLSFDDKGECVYYYSFFTSDQSQSGLNHEYQYIKDYRIKFEDDKVCLELDDGYDTYEIQRGWLGTIDSLYNITYDRELEITWDS